MGLETNVAACGQQPTHVKHTREKVEYTLHKTCTPAVPDRDGLFNKAFGVEEFNNSMITRKKINHANHMA